MESEDGYKQIQHVQLVEKELAHKYANKHKKN
jgi:hypothetical protein